MTEHKITCITEHEITTTNNLNKQTEKYDLLSNLTCLKQLVKGQGTELN